MKILRTLLLALLFANVGQAHPTHKKLAEINRYWLTQYDVSRVIFPETAPASDRELIRLHLQLVEQVLRSRNTTSLTPHQRSNRDKSLDDLHAYWRQGNFPRNEAHDCRLPVFIDKHDNFCAVGYLIKASGKEDISRMIADHSNFAYVKDMHYPELSNWAEDHGFTVDELAWIQPSYMPESFAGAVGRGVNGTVCKLYTDATDSKMYVGGYFSHADSLLPAGNIAFVTSSGGSYTWHSMGTGVNGRVNAITEFEGNIYVGGKFSVAGGSAVDNIAYWDGSAWHAAGCLMGEVKDLTVFNGQLYAAGNFNVCASLPEANFARLDKASGNWEALPALEGYVNTLHAYKDTLLLGGQFSYKGQPANIIRWTDKGPGAFNPFHNVPDNEVTDIEAYKGKLYASCKQTSPSQKIFLELNVATQTWDSASWALYMPLDTSSSGIIAIYTMCDQDGILMAGGDFVNHAMTITKNCVALKGATWGNDWIVLDSAVYTTAMYKGILYTGGAFRTGNIIKTPSATALNGIAAKINPVSVPTITNNNAGIRLHPNPVISSSLLQVERDNSDLSQLCLYDFTGKVLATYQLEGYVTAIQLPALVPGLYMVALTDDAGNKVIEKLAVQ